MDSSASFITLDRIGQSVLKLRKWLTASLNLPFFARLVAFEIVFDAGKIAVQGPIYPFKARMRPTERVVHAPLEDFLFQQTHSITCR